MQSPEQAAAGLRQLALTEIPPSLAQNPECKDAVVLGALMEMGQDSAVVTLAAFADGQASIYFSSGGGILGSGQHETVKIAAQRFVQFAGVHLREMAPTKIFPLPRVGQTTFYAITREFAYTRSAQEHDLSEGIHSFAPLFQLGHYLISRIRLVSEQEHGER